MTAHDHTTYVPGCFRCELSRDEAQDAAVEPDIVPAALMHIREAHVRRFLDKHPHMFDLIDDAIPGRCRGELASQTAERLRVVPAR